MEGYDVALLMIRIAVKAWPAFADWMRAALKSTNHPLSEHLSKALPSVSDRNARAEAEALGTEALEALTAGDTARAAKLVGELTNRAALGG